LLLFTAAVAESERKRRIEPRLPSFLRINASDMLIAPVLVVLAENRR
jgi:hypothetical protein